MGTSFSCSQRTYEYSSSIPTRSTPEKSCARSAIRTLTTKQSGDLCNYELCKLQAYMSRLLYPRYVWITYGWYQEGWWMQQGDSGLCSNNDIQTFLKGTFALKQNGLGVDKTTQVSSYICSSNKYCCAFMHCLCMYNCTCIGCKLPDELPDSVSTASL